MIHYPPFKIESYDDHNYTISETKIYAKGKNAGEEYSVIRAYCSSAKTIDEKLKSFVMQKASEIAADTARLIYIDNDVTSEIMKLPQKKGKK